MNSTSFGSRFVNKPARSPGLSSTGPDVVRIAAPISFATMFASVVFPSPGGPCNSTWSRASPRETAARMKTPRFSSTACWPVKSSKRAGRNTRSYSPSPDDSAAPRTSNSASSRMFRIYGTSPRNSHAYSPPR